MNKYEIFAVVKNAILSLNKELGTRDIQMDQTLIDHLGMDSLNLANLIESLRLEFTNIDYTPWFVQAAQGGRDTVGGLVDYLYQQNLKQSRGRS